MADNYSDRLRAIDAQIRKGQGKEAQASIQGLLADSVPREHRFQLAALARRVSLHADAIKLLNPIVRPTGKEHFEATENERAEYAASLTYIGAHKEAIDLLRKLDGDKTPDALLYHAFALFSQWDYAAAIPLLERFVKHPNRHGYWQLVGNVNLAAALVYEKHTVKADYLLRQLLHDTGLTASTFLYGNTLELAAQNFIHQKRWAQAEKFLDEAAKVLSATGTWYHFHVRKWKAVLGLLKNGEPALLDGVRLEAREVQHWETLRDCDRFEALQLQNAALLGKLYFGTPFEAFRSRLLSDAAWFSPASLPEFYDWHLGPAGDSSADYDFFSQSRTSFEQGELIHRTLVSLCSDTYRPLRVATLFHELFPDEYYNPRVSPKRVHEAIRRLRKWLTESKTVLGVEEKDGQYCLSASIACRVRLKQSLPRTQLDSRMVQLQAHFDGNSFTAKEASRVLKVSARTVARLFEEPLASGQIISEGEGRAKRYRFAERQAA